jgi:hypothetical protein
VAKTHLVVKLMNRNQSLVKHGLNKAMTQKPFLTTVESTWHSSWAQKWHKFPPKREQPQNHEMRWQTGLISVKTTLFALQIGRWTHPNELRWNVNHIVSHCFTAPQKANNGIKKQRMGDAIAPETTPNCVQRSTQNVCKKVCDPNNQGNKENKSSLNLNTALTKMTALGTNWWCQKGNVMLQNQWSIENNDSETMAEHEQRTKPNDIWTNGKTMNPWEGTKRSFFKELEQEGKPL